MLRRLSAIALLGAWFCASGALLDVAQAFAWVRMFVNYAQTESVAMAANETFAPGKPCAICRAVSKAREAAHPRGTALLSARFEKIVLILDYSGCVVPAPGRQRWPLSSRTCALERDGDVPVPPPKVLSA